MTTLQSSRGVHLRVRNILECNGASHFLPCEDALLPKADKHLYVGCHDLEYSIARAAQSGLYSSILKMGWSSVARYPFTSVLVKGLLEDGLRAWVSYVFVAPGGRVILTRRPRDIFQLLDRPFQMPSKSKIYVCERCSLTPSKSMPIRRRPKLRPLLATSILHHPL